MKKVLLLGIAMLLSVSGCDSSDSDDNDQDDVLRVINSLDIADISFRYKYIYGEDTIILESGGGLGPETIIDVSLEENNIFNFWVNVDGYDEAFKQCTVSKAGHDAGAVEIQVYPENGAFTIRCTSNWK